MYLRILIGAAIIIAGVGVVIVSCGLSFNGYERQFTIWGIGSVAISFSAMAFLCAGAIAVARQSENYSAAWLAVFLTVIMAGADMFGNWAALNHDVVSKREAAAQVQAAYSASETALVTLRSRIGTAEAKLNTLQIGTPEQKQILLQSEGHYDGRIDGRIGPVTSKAMFDFGNALRADLSDMKTKEADHVAVISKGVTVAPASTADFFSLAVAIGLTLASCLASFLGNSLIAGARPTAESIEIERAKTNLLGEVVKMNEYLQDRLAA